MTVYVTGNVVKQGPIKINKGSSLIQAIATQAGKLTGNVEFLDLMMTVQVILFHLNLIPKHL